MRFAGLIVYRLLWLVLAACVAGNAGTPVRALLIAFANGREYGNGMRLCGGAELDDGLLDATIVEDRPGITRDRKELDAEWLGVPFRVIDTGGWLPRGDDLDAKVPA